ncbi:hypothetical protein, partial [Rhodopirellula bahusiensis]|uniref:hypothetical protein n=2 Tax=Rhodopirellula bahusiensis TaxID=2014065 RepID=UPI00329A279F
AALFVAELLSIAAVSLFTGSLWLFTPLWGHWFVAKSILRPHCRCPWPPSPAECVGLILYLSIAAVACYLHDLPSYYGSLGLRTDLSFVGFSICYWWLGRRLVARQGIAGFGATLGVFTMWLPASTLAPSAAFFSCMFVLSAIIELFEASSRDALFVLLLAGPVIWGEVWLYRFLRSILARWSRE